MNHFVYKSVCLDVRNIFFVISSFLGTKKFLRFELSRVRQLHKLTTPMNDSSLFSTRLTIGSVFSWFQSLFGQAIKLIHFRNGLINLLKQCYAKSLK